MCDLVATNVLETLQIAKVWCVDDGGCGLERWQLVRCGVPELRQSDAGSRAQMLIAHFVSWRIMTGVWSHTFVIGVKRASTMDDLIYLFCYASEADCQTTKIQDIMSCICNV